MEKWIWTNPVIDRWLSKAAAGWWVSTTIVVSLWIGVPVLTLLAAEHLKIWGQWIVGLYGLSLWLALGVLIIVESIQQQKMKQAELARQELEDSYTVLHNLLTTRDQQSPDNT